MDCWQVCKKGGKGRQWGSSSQFCRGGFPRGWQLDGNLMDGAFSPEEVNE